MSALLSAFFKFTDSDCGNTNAVCENDNILCSQRIIERNNEVSYLKYELVSSISMSYFYKSPCKREVISRKWAHDKNMLFKKWCHVVLEVT